MAHERTDVHPPNKDLDDFLSVRNLIDEHFDVSDVYISDNFIRFTVHSVRGDYETIRRCFASYGYFPLFRRLGGRNMCTLVKFRQRLFAPSRETWIALGLLAATVLTTLWTGWIMAQQYAVIGGRAENPWLDAALFSAGLLLILGGHELGHKWAAARNGVVSTPPYFIPAPPPFPFGTLGAIIKMRSPMPNRDAMIEVGATGPIVGFLLALPVMIAGLALSHVVPMSSLPKGESMLFGEPLLLTVMSRLFFDMGSGHVLVLHPLGFAAWVGLFVTSLNLIPMGQLDGGHVARALLGRQNANRLTWAVVGLLLILGMFQFTGWILWAVLGAALSRRRAAIINDITPVSPQKRLLGLAALVIFALTFIPSPVYAPLLEFFEGKF